MSKPESGQGVYPPLLPLIEQAEREGKWLREKIDHTTFTPSELREKNDNGYFRWGPENWVLDDPQEILESIDRQIAKLEQKKQSVIERMNRR